MKHQLSKDTNKGQKIINVIVLLLSQIFIMMKINLDNSIYKVAN